jgi:hypothetical protein
MLLPEMAPTNEDRKTCQYENEMTRNKEKSGFYLQTKQQGGIGVKIERRSTKREESGFAFI